MSSPRSRLRISKLIICGVQTPNCIRATAFDAAELDYEVWADTTDIEMAMPWILLNHQSLFVPPHRKHLRRLLAFPPR